MSLGKVANSRSTCGKTWFLRHSTKTSCLPQFLGADWWFPFCWICPWLLMVGVATGTVPSVRCRLNGGCSGSSGRCLCPATRGEPWLGMFPCANCCAWVVAEAAEVAPFEVPLVSGTWAESPGLGVDVSVNNTPRNVIRIGGYHVF